MTAKKRKNTAAFFTDVQPEQVIAERRRYLEQKETVVSTLKKAVIIALSLWLVLSFVFGVAVMKGEGMYPRIRDGDLMIFYRVNNSAHTGDVMTFRTNTARSTGRVVAVGGDTVDISEAGELIINGNFQTEEIFYLTEKVGGEVAFPLTVPENSVFLLGDMRTGAVDSRSYGAINLDDIDGKIISILRRRGI